MTIYQCPICKKIIYIRGFPSESGHRGGWCIHGDVLILMVMI